MSSVSLRKGTLSNDKLNLLNNVTVGIINMSLLFYFLYNIFAKSYLPNYGTAILLAVLSAIALLYVAFNFFLRGINNEEYKRALKDGTSTGNIEKYGEDDIVFRRGNAVKMLFIGIITLLASVGFFKYYGSILKNHDKIPRFDSFFMLIIFSLMAQSMYIGSLQSTYLKELITKYVSNTYRSIIIFGILNFINIIFLGCMYIELKYKPTDG